MREIFENEISKVIEELFISACEDIPENVIQSLK